MNIASIVSTKGGPGKTTVTANLGAFCADAQLRTLLIDLDTQPSLSSFYRLEHEAPGGIFDFFPGTLGSGRTIHRWLRS